MKLTVLGKYGPFPAPGGACSGYLLEADGTTLMLDLGSGTLSRLLQRKPELDLSGILLSHLHSDHMADMLILRYALQQYSSRGRPVPLPVAVVAPNAPELEYRQLAASGVYDMIAARDGLKVRFGTVIVTLHRAVHPVPSYAMTIEHGGKKLVYTGDTGYREDLIDVCRNADVLLADTGFLAEDNMGPLPAHLTTVEAVHLATQARVKQLICTHIWGGYTDAQVAAEVLPACPFALIAEEFHEYYI